MNSEGEILYHVIRECVTFLASTQIRKRSRIIFFDQQQHQVAEYRVGLPEELPFKLSNNTLYFRNKGTAHQEVLGSELQETLCVSAEECYWKE